MTAYVVINGMKYRCQAKDPSHCRYHKNPDGSNMTHYATEATADNVIERQAEHRAKVDKYYSLIEKQEQIIQNTGKEDYDVADAIDYQAMLLRVDSEWEKTKQILHEWAGFSTNIDDPNAFDNNKVSNETVLHETAHAITAMVNGHYVREIQVGYKSGTAKNSITGEKMESLGLTYVGDLSEEAAFQNSLYKNALINSLTFSVAGRHIDEAFDVDPASWRGDNANNEYYFRQYLPLIGEDDTPGTRQWYYNWANRNVKEIISNNIKGFLALADLVKKRGRVLGFDALNVLRSNDVNLQILSPKMPARPVNITVPPPPPIFTNVPAPPTRTDNALRKNDGSNAKLVKDNLGRLRLARP